MSSKPGHRTTEFWLTVLVSVWGAVAPGLPPEWQAAIPAAATGVYSLARGLAKGGLIRGSVGQYLSRD